MSEYNQKQQTEIVRDAMTLTTAIQIEQEELSRLKGEKFKSTPTAPTREILKPTKIEPEIPDPPKTDYSYSKFLSDTLKRIKKYIIIAGVAIIILSIIVTIINKSLNSENAVGNAFYSENAVGNAFFITGILGLIFPAAGILLIVSVFMYFKKKKELNEQLAHSPEYLKAVANAKKFAEEKQKNINAEIEKKQTEIDSKYKSDLEHYNTTTISNYNKEKTNWNKIHNEKIKILEEDLNLNKETLSELYDTTRLISLTYRELWILRWIYDDMRSSDHDVRYATELLDRDRQRLVTEQSGRMIRESINDMHSSMVDGFQAVYEAVEEGNEELAKTRRDQNRAEIVGIAQRHNLNKMTKIQNEMLNEHFNKK